jgi:hypothetical protein
MKPLLGGGLKRGTLTRQPTREYNFVMSLYESCCQMLVASRVVDEKNSNY